jgi:hypothetical protein
VLTNIKKKVIATQVAMRSSTTTGTRLAIHCLTLSLTATLSTLISSPDTDSGAVVATLVIPTLTLVANEIQNNYTGIIK